MRVRVAAICCVTLAGLSAGCAHRPSPQPVQVAPNPFGYLKRSAVCVTSPLDKPAASRSVEMKTRSDDGQCGLTISQPEGGAYASFLLTSLPLHGNSFIYNYDKQTYVTYTAATAYAGTDAFTVSLVPGGGKPRTALKVDVSVDATGVVVPPPPVATPEPKPAARRKGRHTAHHHR